jgi:hypothetical protein
MFVTTALLYPVVLLLLCLGTGLLVDRVSGAFLPAALLPSVGAAGAIALSQLSTYAYPLAPATPYVAAAAALAGFVLGRGRAAALARSTRQHPWRVLLPILVYGIALAPVLLGGRASLSSYMALTDSAVHIVGADYLLHHGQHYVHLDLRNSYGQYINDYYNSNYPSGADTLFGASALLVRLSLLWAFQPFNAFMLAIASGPAWLLARRAGLSGVWAGLAALTAVVPALVYAYELFASVKEITALTMILTLGALIVVKDRWVRAGPRGIVPFALVIAAGVSALGVAFGVWALVAVVVLVPAFWRELRVAGGTRGRALASLAIGVLVAFLAALPTWTSISGSVQVAQGVAATSNPGNLTHPLRAIQLFGIWLGGSYKLDPSGTALGFTYALIAVAFVAAVAGVWQLVRVRAFSLLAWFTLMLLACLVVAESVTTWGAAKTLMLTSSIVVLLAWAGVAALRALRPHVVALATSTALAFVFVGGVVASDARQYHVSNLAPTARYRELASLNSRFAHEGPALFTDFDEYSLYLLRDLDVGGPDFIYPPPSAAEAADGHGLPEHIDLLSPAVLRHYPLIVTRRDPLASRPPAAYRLVWQGSYYQVWQRRPGAQVAARHEVLLGNAAAQCRRIGDVAAAASVPPSGATLAVARVPDAVHVNLQHARHPRSWGPERSGLKMGTTGTLSAAVAIPRGGRWEVWVQGQIMPPVSVSIDGHLLGTVSGELGGNSLVVNIAPPIPATLSAGTHHLVIRRGGSALAPGDGGAAFLSELFLTPAGGGEGETLLTVPISRWRSLCGGLYRWIELSIGGRA